MRSMDILARVQKVHSLFKDCQEYVQAQSSLVYFGIRFLETRVSCLFLLILLFGMHMLTTTYVDIAVATGLWGGVETGVKTFGGASAGGDQSLGSGSTPLAR